MRLRHQNSLASKVFVEAVNETTLTDDAIILGACKKKNIKPSIVIVVVDRRHHVRFFPMNKQEADKSGNCKAGTVVDKDIVHPLEFEFYLQSHQGVLGTSRPAHYRVLHDDVGLTLVSNLNI